MSKADQKKIVVPIHKFEISDVLNDEEHIGFVITWQDDFECFGNIYFWMDKKTKQITIDPENMSKEFVRKIVSRFISAGKLIS